MELRNRGRLLVIGLLCLVSGVVVLTDSTLAQLLYVKPAELGALSRGALAVALVGGTLVAADERGILSRRTVSDVLVRGKYRMEVVAGMAGLSLFIAEASRLGASFPTEVVALGDLLLPITVVFFGIQVFVLAGSTPDESVNAA